VGLFVQKAVRLLQATEPTAPVVEAKQTEIVEVLPAVLLNESAEATVKFTIVNHLGRAVKLTDIRTPCACTSATLERKKLSEGESTVLTVKATFPRQPGVQKLAVYVSEENGHVWRCEMQRKLVASGRFQPGQFSFGTLAGGTSAETTATLELAGKTKAELEGQMAWQCNSMQLKATPDQDDFTLNSEYGFWRRKITVRLQLTAPTEPGFGNAVVSTILPNTQRTVDLFCNWRVDDPPASVSSTPSETKR
jgi:hypothetical protein